MPTFDHVTERMRLEPAYMEALARFRKSEAETRILDAQRQRLDQTLRAAKAYRDEVDKQITAAKQRAARLDRQISNVEEHRETAIRLLRGTKLNAPMIAWRSFTFFLNDAMAVGGIGRFEDLTIKEAEYRAEDFLPEARVSVGVGILGLVDFMRSLALVAKLGTPAHRDLARLFERIDEISRERLAAMQQALAAIENGTFKEGLDRLKELGDDSTEAK